MSQHQLDATNGEIILFLNYEKDEQKIIQDRGEGVE
jgi:hypothetical protein